MSCGVGSLGLQDVHAGNLFVLNDGRVAFIDFGIVGRFSPGTWSGVSRLADGVAAEDFTVMAEVRIYLEKVVDGIQPQDNHTLHILEL